MGKMILYTASALISAVILTSVAVLCWYEIADHNVLSDISVSPYLAVFAAILLPRETDATRWPYKIIRGLVVAAFLSSVVYFLFHRPFNERLEMLFSVGIWAGVIAVVLLLRGTVKLAFRKWQDIKSPALRLVIGTAVLTAIITIGLVALLLALVGTDWRIVLQNWDVTLIVIYLPIVGVIAGLLYLRRRLEARNVRRDGDGQG